MKINDPPFECYVDSNGYYKSEYIDWCVKRENYPGSDLMHEDSCGDARFKQINDTCYVEVGFPFDTRESANKSADIIRELGGVAIIIPCQRMKKRKFMIWYNPNGSRKAREYVIGW